MEANKIKGVRAIINKDTTAHTPYGYDYVAKGFYIQGKKVVVVGQVETGSTVRLSYPADDVHVKII